MAAYLNNLESEAIHILREVAAEFRKPVLLYSGGKDSSVMAHLAIKAFYPGKPPFPLLHIDTTWKFRDLLEFRNRSVAELGMDLIVHTNAQGAREGIDPVRADPALYTRIMKTEALKQAFEMYGFDAGLTGARRDEDMSRSKERVFSFRNAMHAWDPRSQRPEIWRLYNTRIRPGESVRVFPLASWTELDVWRYIAAEGIAVAPLYFAAERPVVERGGQLIMVDDERLVLQPGESVRTRRVRFRSLGCYPLTGAFPSDAGDVSQIIAEMTQARTSERHGRVADHDQPSSMEKKKREGYF